MRDRQAGDFSAGASLMFAAVASVLAMAHHPVSAHSSGSIGDTVHGAMIVLLSVLFYGLAHFTLRRGLWRPLMLAGLVAYGVSLFAHLGAGTINGFVVPALAARDPGEVSHDIFILCREANQTLATLGVYATGIAFLLWAVDFLLRTELSNRITGAIGILSGILPAAALTGGFLELSVTGAFVIYSTHGLWAALVGVQLMRGKI